MRAFVGQLRFAFVPTSLLCLTLLAVAPQSALGAYPDKPIKIIVPFAPGGGVDIMARLIGDFMSKDFGKPVISRKQTRCRNNRGNEWQPRAAPPTVIRC